MREVPSRDKTHPPARRDRFLHQDGVQMPDLGVQMSHSGIQMLQPDAKIDGAAGHLGPTAPFTTWATIRWASGAHPRASTCRREQRRQNEK